MKRIIEWLWLYAKIKWKVLNIDWEISRLSANCESIEMATKEECDALAVWPKYDADKERLRLLRKERFALTTAVKLFL